MFQLNSESRTEWLLLSVCIKILCAFNFRPLTYFVINCRCRVGRWRTHCVAHPAIPWTHSCICDGRGNQQLRADDRKLHARNAKQRNSIRLLIRTQFPQPAGEEMRDYVLDRLHTVSLTATNAKKKRWESWFAADSIAPHLHRLMNILGAVQGNTQHFFVVFSLSRIT